MPLNRHTWGCSILSTGRIRLTSILIVAIAAGTQVLAFDFTRQLFGDPPTMEIWFDHRNPATGLVIVNGYDSRSPTTPFSFDWGDGTTSEGFFPQEHTYADPSRNYVIDCTAHYDGGQTDTVRLPVYFTAPVVEPAALPIDRRVSIPETDVVLGTRLYTPPVLSHYDESHFGEVPRPIIAYVLSVFATIVSDLVSGDVIDADGSFRQLVLRDPNGSMYSLWYTNPVACAAGQYAMRPSIPWSSFMHELGHNFTLNTPARFYYGGRIDGNANAIYSETMAQIMQHTAAYELLNEYEPFGLGDDLLVAIEDTAVDAMEVVRHAYERYLSNGNPFHSWNDPGTPQDETYDTFMTLAYKFCEHAETDGMGYALPATRMIQLLQTFDSEMMDSYDRFTDSPEADAYRATLMVTAMSHGFQTDLRSEFSALGFPIDGTIYDELMSRVTGLEAPGKVSGSVRVDRVSSTELRIGWSPSDCGGGTDYGVYEGRLGDWTSHRQIDCYDDGGDLEEVVEFASGDTYYLVVPHSVVSEGSFGTDSSSTERSRGISGCALEQTLGCP